MIGCAQLERRITLTSGEEFNGVELWGAIFTENIFGLIEMQRSERGCFNMFPKCVKDEELQVRPQQWMRLQLKSGAGLPEDPLQQMRAVIRWVHTTKHLSLRKASCAISERIACIRFGCHLYANV